MRQRILVFPEFLRFHNWVGHAKCTWSSLSALGDGLPHYSFWWVEGTRRGRSGEQKIRRFVAALVSSENFSGTQQNFVFTVLDFFPFRMLDQNPNGHEILRMGKDLFNQTVCLWKRKRALKIIYNCEEIIRSDKYLIECFIVAFIFITLLSNSDFPNNYEFPSSHS